MTKSSWFGWNAAMYLRKQEPTTASLLTNRRDLFDSPDCITDQSIQELHPVVPCHCFFLQYTTQCNLRTNSYLGWLTQLTGLLLNWCFVTVLQQFLSLHTCVGPLLIGSTKKREHKWHVQSGVRVHAVRAFWLASTQITFYPVIFLILTCPRSNLIVV